MYKLTENPDIVINLDTSEWIPVGSRQWDDYQDWLTAGNTPDPALNLDEIKTAKINEMNQACSDQIYLGFNSNATGTWRHYPAKDTDQQNLSASVLDSVLAIQMSETDWSTPFWCADSDTDWFYLNHNAQQIQQVGRDAKAQILACLLQKATLAAQVSAMTSEDQINAVTWVSPVGADQPTFSTYNLPTS